VPLLTRAAVAPLALLLAAGLLAGCSGDPGAGGQASAGSGPPGAASSTPSTGGSSSPGSSGSTSGGAEVYVAVGASETVGVGADDPATQAWPRVLHERVLPGSRFVDLGVSGSTLQAALAAQLPSALAARPDVVTVWLAVNDAVAGVPVPRYERQLARLVRALRQGGRAKVLVGNVPDLWRLPAYRACLPSSGGRPVDGVTCRLPVVPTRSQVKATVAAFNAAIARVVRSQGARLVDLAREDDLAGLTAADGFHPSTEGHREIARAFARVLRRTDR
jgi:acyl-CoA thioesterase I